MVRFPDADPAHQILSAMESREWRRPMGRPRADQITIREELFPKTKLIADAAVNIMSGEGTAGGNSSIHSSFTL